MAEPTEFMTMLNAAISAMDKDSPTSSVFVNLIAMIRDLNKRLTIAEMTIEAWSDHEAEVEEEDDEG